MRDEVSLGAARLLQQRREHRIQFTASAELHAKLERLKVLMRPSVPDGDLAAIIEQAVSEKLDRLEARRFAKTPKPRKELSEADASADSRYIPAPIRRAVYERDRGQCRFADQLGRRCPERGNLEFHHHDTPFGRGGDHRADGIRLMCPAHNALLAEREYGTAKMARYRRAAGPDRVGEERAIYATVAAPTSRGWTSAVPFSGGTADQLANWTFHSGL